MNRYPNNLRKIRTERGLMQKDAAAMLGLHCQDRLSHWEVGRACPSVENIKKLCAIYGVRFEDIY